MDESTLNIVNAVAAVLSAVGTVSAVIVALYLARRDEMLRLRIRATTGGVLSKLGSRFEVLINVANIGRRPVQVTSLTWRVGWRKQQHFFQKLDEYDPDSARLPSKLEDGDHVVYVVPIEDFDDHFRRVIAELPWLERRLAHWSMRLLVHTSAGKTFVARLDSVLRDHVAQLASGNVEVETEKAA